MLGVAPILMPLTVDQISNHNALHVGLVIAAFYVGGLFAPVLGSLADKKGIQRAVFLWCFPIMGLGIIGFALANEIWMLAVLACIFGGAGSLSGTVAGLFVVEANPEAEWNSRLSWFRLSYGAGQVVGLIIAALAVSSIALGWYVTAGLLIAATFIGRIGLPQLKAVQPEVSADESQQVSAQASPHSASPAVKITPEPQNKRSHKLFPVFIVVWLLTMTGIQTFFNVVPLVMRDGFQIDPATSSLLFLVGAAIGTVLYPFAGDLANRIGSGLVLLLGMALTMLGFAAMTAAVALNLEQKAWVGGAALVVAATAYAFTVVAATMMIVKIAPSTEGSAMGLLNGLIAGGAVIGALVPSYLAALWGYAALPAVALAVLAVACVLAIPLFPRSIWLEKETSTPHIGAPELSEGASA